MQSFNDVWNAVCSCCAGTISDVGYNMWIKIITPVELKNGEAVLSVPNAFQRDVVEQSYSKQLLDAFELVLGFPVKLKLLCEDEANFPAAGAGTVVTTPREEYAYTFETYIVGASNRFAHAASMAVAENPSIVYNPLFIYGNSGVGKTHLLLAILNRVQEKFPHKKTVYVRAEDFTNDLIKSIANGTMNEFHNKFRTADLLLLDDIQFIAGKESTQEEFFNTFNSLYMDQKQIVVTSDRPPKDIKTLDERIRSRFECGLLADIAPPDFETRVGIIRRKAQLLRLTLDDDVVFYIADQIKMNIRQLEGVVKKLQASTMLDGTRPTISVAQNVIRDIRNDSQPEPVTVGRILSEVARTYSVSVEDIRSKKQNAPVSKVRQVAMYIVREVTKMPLEEIGEQFGRNHSTVVYALKKTEESIRRIPKERETIEDIIKNLQSDQ